MFVVINPVNCCSRTVLRVVIACKGGSTCNGMACTGLKLQLCENLLRFARAKSKSIGTSAVLLSPAVTTGMLRLISAALDCC